MNDIIKELNNEEIAVFAKKLSKLSPTEYVTLGTTIALIVTQIMDPLEQNSLGNFLEMVGQILLTYYAQATLVDPNFQSFSISDSIKLKKQIISLVKNKKITKEYYDHN